MSDNLDLLTRVPLFKKLPEKTLGRLNKLIVEREFPADADMVKEGGEADAFFLLKSGSAEVRHGGSILRSLAAGDYFGEMALLDGQPRSATVRAVAPVTCLVLARRDFLAELRANPELGIELLENLSLRFRALEADPLRVQSLRDRRGGSPQN